MRKTNEEISMLDARCSMLDARCSMLDAKTKFFRSTDMMQILYIFFAFQGKKIFSEKRASSVQDQDFFWDSENLS
jgi:hypothetical protein